MLALCHLRQRQHAIGDLQPAAGRHDVDVIGLNVDRLCDLRHRDRSSGLQNFGKFAVVVRRQMQDDNVRSTAPRRNLGEKGAKRFDPSGRGANSDHEQRVRPWLGSCTAAHCVCHLLGLVLRAPGGLVFRAS